MNISFVKLCEQFCNIKYEICALIWQIVSNKVSKKVRKKERKKERQKDRETERQRDRETNRQTDKQKERKKDRKKERQTDRQTDRQTESKTERKNDKILSKGNSGFAGFGYVVNQQFHSADIYFKRFDSHLNGLEFPKSLNLAW